MLGFNLTTESGSNLRYLNMCICVHFNQPLTSLRLKLTEPNICVYFLYTNLFTDYAQVSVSSAEANTCAL